MDMAGHSRRASRLPFKGLWYGTFQALRRQPARSRAGSSPSLIGPSGCGKSTFLRSVNRINERLGYVRTSGEIEVLGHDIYGARGRARPGAQAGRHGLPAAQPAAALDPRQRPLRLPSSTAEGHVVGTRARRTRSSERRSAAGPALGPGQGPAGPQGDRPQPRGAAKALHRAAACRSSRRSSSWTSPARRSTPKATTAVEELIWELRGQYTIVIVTHNMAQARRASDECIFMLHGQGAWSTRETDRHVRQRRRHKETADYIEGRYG